MMMMRFMACQVSIKYLSTYYLLYPCFTPQPDSPTFQKLFCGIIIWIRDAGVEYATVWDSFTWPNYVHIAICVWLLHNFMELQFNSILTRANSCTRLFSLYGCTILENLFQNHPGNRTSVWQDERSVQYFFFTNLLSVSTNFQ